MKAAWKHGFTLFELLVVVAVVSLLAAVFIAWMDSGRRRAKVERTRALLCRISNALQSYKEHYLAYPPSNAPLSSPAANLHWSLCAPHWTYPARWMSLPAGSDCFCGPAPSSAGPFMDNLSDHDVASGKAHPWNTCESAPSLASEIIDSWDTALGYYCVPQGPTVYGGTNHRSKKHADWCDNSATFDLWSRGPDTSLPPPSAFGPPSPTVGENREITNWTPR